MVIFIIFKLFFDLRIFSSEVAVVQYLVSAGADIQLKDKMGQTPIFEASLNGNREQIEVLHKLGNYNLNFCENSSSNRKL